MSIDRAISAAKNSAKIKGKANDNGRQPRRGPGRPRKQLPIPNSKGLPALPPELIGRIATFLLPSPTTPETGFAPPTEYPYGSKQGITQQNKSSRYGGIPSGVRDVLRLAQTCKACDAGVESVVGKIGDGSNGAKKRTLYISFPEPETERYRTKTQSEVEQSEAGQTMKQIRASCDTLEHLVVLSCTHKGNRPSWTSSTPVLYAVLPFQNTETSFSKLQHIQLGPEVCCTCAQVMLRLFCAKTFHRTGQRLFPEPEDDDENDDVPTRRAFDHDDIREHDRLFREEFDEPAAPNLISIQITLDIQRRNQHTTHMTDYSAIRDLYKRIANPKQIKMFQIWLLEHDEWGGMGCNGSVTSVPTKDAKTVEAELTEWAKQELEKGRSAQDRLLERFKAQARAALPVKTTAKTNKRKHGPTTLNSLESEPDHEGDTSNDPDAKRSKSKVTTSSDEVETQVKIEQDSESVDESHADRSMSASTSSDTRGPGGDMTRAARHVERNRQSSILAYRDLLRFIAGEMPDLVGLSIQRRGGARLDLTETRGDLDEFTQNFVAPIAKLDKLRYLDLGLAVAGVSEVSSFPLGLSFSTTRSGRDKAKELDPALQALKRRKYTLDMTKAKAEGDQWRKTVLERCFGLPSSSPTDKNGSAESSSSTADSSTGAGAGAGGGTSNTMNDVDGEETEPKPTWPESLRSGYFVAPDLENRVRYQGAMIPWRIKEEKVVLGTPVKMRL